MSPGVLRRPDVVGLAIVSLCAFNGHPASIGSFMNPERVENARLTSADILVVGAGPAGLAVSACLRDAGLSHTVVEREHDVASAWRRHYARLHLHTIKKYSTLPGMPWPNGTPKYPTREMVVAYLTRYAAERAVTPAFGIEVKRITRDGDRFNIETSNGALHPRFVVVATGYNGIPNQPAIPGLDTFTGRTTHSRNYADARPYSGLRTLVVGCGNSGAEIALDLAENGVNVSMVVRSPTHVVPRDLLGRPSQQTAVMLSRLPLGVRDAIVGSVLKLAVGDLSRWGIVRPNIGPQRMIEEHGRMPILDIGTIAMVKAGRIGVRPAVTSISERTVHFANDVKETYDAIIFATGYTPSLDRIVHNFNTIADHRQRPHRFGEETAIAGLYFVGFRNPSTGALREISIEAKRVAVGIAHVNSTGFRKQTG